MTNPIPSTLQPYAPHAIPHPAGRWARWLAAWRGPSTVWPRCPGERDQSTECGDILIRRRGKRGGWFLGCASYPSCKYTRGAGPPALDTSPSESCPLCDGYIDSKREADEFKFPYTYRRCSTCGAFPGSRFITAKEKPKVAADEAARKEKKRIAKARKTAKGRKAQREMVVQKPVEGWTPADWYGEEWDATGWMPEKWLAKRGL